MKVSKCRSCREFQSLHPTFSWTHDTSFPLLEHFWWWWFNYLLRIYHLHEWTTLLDPELLSYNICCSLCLPLRICKLVQMYLYASASYTFLYIIASIPFVLKNLSSQRHLEIMFLSSRCTLTFRCLSEIKRRLQNLSICLLHNIFSCA